MVKSRQIVRTVVFTILALATLIAGAGQALAGNVSPTEGSPQTSNTLTLSSGNPVFANTVTGAEIVGHFPFNGSHFNATSVTVLNDYTVSATFPAGCVGGITYSVFVYTNDPFNPSVNPGDFTCVAPPNVTGVSPSSGTTLGGTTIYISGSNLNGATAVTVGGTAALNVSVPNSNTIVATTPAGTAGAASVVVTTVGGSNAANSFFTYVLPPAPTVTSITPNSGPNTGGTSVTITGTHLGGATSVTIGGGAASGVTIVDDNTITATTPSGILGAADVAVTTPSGTGTGVGLFTYVPPPPTVTAIGPTNGPTAGGTFVTITGNYFTGATAVTIGGTPVTSFNVTGPNSITAITAPHAAGVALDVVVTTPYGIGTGVDPMSKYTYGTPPPTVFSVSPALGPIAGGTPITIGGADFTGATSVTIGGSSVAFTVVDASHITATTPPHAEGSVNVTVTTPIGTGTGVSLFTYTPPPPTVISITPASGPTTGFTPVTITGTKFTGAVMVTIGGTAATGVVVVNDNTITAITPAGVAGAANVVVTTPAGAGTGIGLYTYITPPPGATPAPTVTSISPTSGTTLGGTAVTITGTDFTGATSVTIGGNPATGVTVVNATTITAISPAHAAGATDVIVITPNGAGLGSGIYTYVTPGPTVSAISPSSGPIVGGTFVTITGTNFVNGATTVTIGGNAATGLTVVNSTTITATTPAHAAGAVNVVVVTPGGNGTVVFIYQTPAPTVTAVSPSSGPTTGGTAVTITGANLSGATAVKFGTSNAASFTVISATQITATSPAGSLGSVYVTVTTPGGTSAPSAGAQFTYSVPSDSQKLHTLQTSITPMVAQISGQAIAGAIDGAIAAGFSGDPQALTSNGSGFTYYFEAAPDEQRTATTAPDSGPLGYAAAPAESTSRVDDAFEALGYNRKRAARVRPRPIVSERKWLAWIDFRGTGSNSRGGGNDIKGTQANVLAGLTYKLTPDFLVGMLGGYEYFNYTSDTLSGKMTGSGWTVGTYLGWRITQNVRLDAAVAGSSIGYDASAGTATGNFTGTRFLASGGLTGTYRWQAYIFEPSARLYGLWETEKAYTDSLGTAQPERKFTSGRASGGAKVSYPLGQRGAVSYTPYVGLYGDYYFASDDASTAGLTSTPLMQGWSARVTTGIGMRFDRGAQVSIGGELGGIGGNTTTWTVRARGSVPF